MKDKLQKLYNAANLGSVSLYFEPKIKEIDEQQTLFVTAAHDELVRTAIGLALDDYEALKAARNHATSSYLNVAVAMILHPDAGVQINPGKGRDGPPNIEVPMPGQGCLYSEDIKKIMLQLGHTPAASDFEASVDRYFLWKPEIKVIEDISGKPIAELIAQQKPNRPAHDNGKQSVRTPAPGTGA